MRDQLINEKASAVQQELTTWAEENNVLMPGEQLVFTLSRMKIPLTVRSESAVFATMFVSDFFKYGRLIDMGLPKYMATRMETYAKYHIDRWWRNTEEDPTMQDFMNMVDARILRKDIGVKTIRAIVEILNRSGFDISSAKWKV